MAFARRRSRSFRGPRRFGVRRRNPYELAQISVCRKGMELGLSDCGVPDQFFTPLVVAKTWLTPLAQVQGAGVTTENILPAHETRGIHVRGIQFDYHYSYVPDVGTVENAAVGVTGIRSALVVLRANFQGSGGQFDPILPASPPSNMLHYSQALRTEGELGSSGGAGIGSAFELTSRFRMLWRGLDMLGTAVVEPFAGGVIGVQTRVIQAMTPLNALRSRHVRVRTGATLGIHDALFLVTEVVNPFLELNPILGLDLFGSLVVKTVQRGTRYET